MICFKCGTDNLDGANFCSKCNFKLPKIDAKVAPTTSAPKAGRLSKILELFNGYLEGEISPDSVAEELRKHEEAFQKSHNKFKNMNLPKELKDEFQIQVDTGLKGIELFLKSFEMVRATIPENINDDEPFELDDESRAKILKAIDRAQKGNDYLNECFEQSAESLRQAQDEAYMHENYQDFTKGDMAISDDE